MRVEPAPVARRAVVDFDAVVVFDGQGAVAVGTIHTRKSTRSAHWRRVNHGLAPLSIEPTPLDWRE